jgi:hypothetical protein
MKVIAPLDDSIVFEAPLRRAIPPTCTERMIRVLGETLRMPLPMCRGAADRPPFLALLVLLTIRHCDEFP